MGFTAVCTYARFSGKQRLSLSILLFCFDNVSYRYGLLKATPECTVYSCSSPDTFGPQIANYRQI